MAKESMKLPKAVTKSGNHSVELRQTPFSNCGRETPNCESVVAVVRGRDVVEAIVQQMPDDTLCITFSEPSSIGTQQDDQETAVGVSAVLSLARQATESRELRYAYTFADAEHRFPAADVFRTAGFRMTDEIIEFNASETLLPAAKVELGDVTFHHAEERSFEQGMPFSKTAWDSFLQNVVQESLDLKQLPPPTPKQLQAMWQLPDADYRLTVALQKAHPIGLAVLSSEDWEATNSVIIEYFGVHASDRRRGLGNTLLRATREQFPTAAGKKITTFVAAENVVAAAFFESSGFCPGAARELWVHVPTST